MINSVEQYLAALKKELAGSDRATVQDALSDAEEYLRTSIGNLPADKAEAEVLSEVIQKYGTPAEVAAAYKQFESRTPPVFAEQLKTEPEETPPPVPPRDTRPFYARFFGIFTEWRAWSALLYLMLAMFTGIAYFTWVVTGVSVSAGLIILVVGLPIMALFLLSVRGVSLVEGRLVEALLGVRMPRRPRYAEKKGIWQWFKKLVADKHTWFSMVYMLLQMPLGIFYFSFLVTLIAVSLSLIIWPITAVIAGWPVFIGSATAYYATGWLIPIGIITGGLLLTGTLHLAKAMGRGHGVLAKALLVRP